MAELWLMVSGRRGEPPPLRGAPPDWEDEPEIILSIEIDGYGDEPPSFSGSDLPTIAGACVEIVYRDAKGREAARRITCRRLTETPTAVHLHAFCHERQALRQFRADRIAEVIDPETGEVLSVDEFLAGFRATDTSQLGLTWGLGVKRKARLVSALRVLVFLARADNEWHPLELDEIERFVAVYYLRSGLTCEPPMREILSAVRRMAPMPEDFYLSLRAVAKDRELLNMVRPFFEAVVHADGELRGEELFWGLRLDETLREMAAA